MKILGLNKAVKVRLQSLDTATYIDIRSEIIDYYLYRAMVQLVKTRYGGNNSKGTGFEINQKRLEDLRELIGRETITTYTSGFDANGSNYTLPKDYWLAVRENVKVRYTCGGATKTNLANVRPVTHDKLNKLIKDPFNKPWEEEVLRVAYPGINEIIVGEDQAPIEYKLVYIKRPKIFVSVLADWQDALLNIGETSLTISDFTDTPEVGDILRDDIVNEAVAMLQADTNNPNYKVSLNEILKEE